MEFHQLYIIGGITHNLFVKMDTFASYMLKIDPDANMVKNDIQQNTDALY